MGRREEKRSITKQQILTAAAELFTEKGYESTTLEDVTERANLSKGTFYYNFESKEDLVVGIRRSALSSTIDEAYEAVARGDNPFLVLEKLLIDRTVYTEKYPELASVFYAHRFEYMFFRAEQKLHEPDKKDEPQGRFRKVVYELVCEAQKVGLIRSDLSPEEVSTLISGCFLHAQGAWLASDRSTSLVDRVHRSIHILFDGLGVKGYRDGASCYTPKASSNKTSSKSSK
jgi:AcrR family transcriptional regulator